MRAAAARRLAAAAVDAPELEAAWLLQTVTGLAPAEQVLERARPLTPDQRDALTTLLERRAAREPLAYVLGTTDFHGLELEVRPGVLVPRPESERLVELVLAEARPAGRLVLDVGTGSGAVALALAAARRQDDVAASDIDPDALALARRNAERLGLRLELHRSDLLAAPAVHELAARADVIVANLPYLPEADRLRAPPELAWEPAHALFAGADGLSLARRLIRQAAALLGAEATLWLELDPRNVDVLAREAAADGWGSVRVERDLSGRRRYLRAGAPPRRVAGAGAS